MQRAAARGCGAGWLGTPLKPPLPDISPESPGPDHALPAENVKQQHDPSAATEPGSANMNEASGCLPGWPGDMRSGTAESALGSRGTTGRGTQGGSQLLPEAISDRKAAVAQAKEYRERSKPRIPSKNLPGYLKRKGKKFPLNAPTLSDKEPNLADMGVGISHYFELLRVMKWMFFLMFILGLPSLVITFLSNPNAASTAQDTAGYLGVFRAFTVSAIFKVYNDSSTGCDSIVCTIIGGQHVSSKVISFVIVYLDLAYSLAFLIAVPILSWRFDRRKKIIEERNLSVSDFTLMVWGIPRDAEPKELESHFNHIKVGGSFMKRQEEDVTTRSKESSDPYVTERVARCYVAYNDGKIIRYFQKMGIFQTKRRYLALQKSTKRSDKQLQKLDSKIAELERKIEIYKDRSKRKAVCAFVVFNMQSWRDACFALYHSSASKEYSLSCWGQKPEFRFKQKYRLNVQSAPDPSDIKWENLEYTSFSRFRRMLLSYFLSFLLVVVSIAFIVAGKSFENKLKRSKNDCVSPSYIESCNAAASWASSVSCSYPDGNVWPCSLIEAWNMTYLTTEGLSTKLRVPLDVNTSVSPTKSLILNGNQCRYRNRDWIPLGSLSTECIRTSSITNREWQAFNAAGWADPAFSNASGCANCICTALMMTNTLTWVKSFDVFSLRGTFRRPDGRALCTEQAWAFASLTALQLAAVLMVVLFNLLMTTVTLFMASFERHHTLAEEEGSSAFFVFIGQYINTFLVVLLVYARIGPLKSEVESKASTVSDILPLFAGDFQDFTESWYAIVGAQLIVTVTLNLILPMAPLVLALMGDCCLPLYSRSISSQSALNHAYAGREFNLSTRYGGLLSAVFGCLMYSSGMPILLLLGALIFFVTYWVDKVYLLRLCQTPSAYSDRVNTACLRYFKYAVLLHLLIGCWIYSAQTTAGSDMFAHSGYLLGNDDLAISGSSSDASCSRLNSTSSCNSVEGCKWQGRVSTMPDNVVREHCTYAVRSANSIASELLPDGDLNLRQRLLSSLVAPYFFFTLLVAIFIGLQWTPLWPLCRATILQIIRTLNACCFRSCCNCCGVEAPRLNQVSPLDCVPAGDPGGKTNGQGSLEMKEIQYDQALEDGLFGNAPSSYDLTALSKYQEIFAQDRNRDLFLGKDALSVMAEPEKDPNDVGGYSGFPKESLMVKISPVQNEEIDGNCSPVHESNRP